MEEDRVGFAVRQVAPVVDQQLAREGIEARSRNRNIADWDLPWPNELIASAQPTDGAVADVNQEGLVSDRRETQYAQGGLLQLNVTQVEPRFSSLRTHLPFLKLRP